MDTQLINQILSNEKKHTCLTSSVIRINENLLRFNDDLLPDMYDNNYFEAEKEVSETDYEMMMAYKSERGDKHLKVEMATESAFLADKGMEKGIILTMVKQDTDYPEKCNLTLNFRCLKDEDITKDLIDMEIKHYAEIYGMDFTLRKCERIYGLAREKSNCLYFFAAYIEDKIVASCSAFYSDNVVGFDDLVTDRDYRNRGIATALMSHVHHFFSCPLFLHADNDDTPKDMYKRMGYTTAKSDYEYLLCDESDL